MRIATWNVNSIRSRIEQVNQWLGENKPDVLCLQETKAAPEQVADEDEEADEEEEDANFGGLGDLFG